MRVAAATGRCVTRSWMQPSREFRIIVTDYVRERLVREEAVEGRGYYARMGRLASCAGQSLSLIANNGKPVGQDIAAGLARAWKIGQGTLEDVRRVAIERWRGLGREYPLPQDAGSDLTESRPFNEWAKAYARRRDAWPPVVALARLYVAQLKRAPSRHELDLLAERISATRELGDVLAKVDAPVDGDDVDGPRRTDSSQCPRRPRWGEAQSESSTAVAARRQRRADAVTAKQRAASRRAGRVFVARCLANAPGGGRTRGAEQTRTACGGGPRGAAGLPVGRTCRGRRRWGGR